MIARAVLAGGHETPIPLHEPLHVVPDDDGRLRLVRRIVFPVALATVRFDESVARFFVSTVFPTGAPMLSLAHAQPIELNGRLLEGDAIALDDGDRIGRADDVLTYVAFGSMNSNAAVALRSDGAADEISYSCTGRRANNGETTVRIFAHPGPITLASAPTPNIVPGESHVLRGGVDDTAITCRWDGDSISANTTNIATGRPGLHVVRATVRFDYVVIYALGP